ncbi:MAG: hypothetical protein K0R57_987 [Paenibacillaceae bacterium]|jgi:hypothetical protein|nr:hypothetical protein [Paenibacillaceae bacterium]
MMSEPVAPGIVESDKEQLKEILSRHEYRTGADIREEGANWLGRGLNSLLRRLGGLLPDGTLPRSASEVISYLVILAGIGLLVFLLIWLGRRYSREWTLQDNRLRLTESELQQTYGDCLLLAEEAAAKGDYREGVRYVFLALLLYAADKGWVRMEQWKSNGEYALELAARQPGLKPLFAEARGLYDQVYYGMKDAAEADFTDILHKVAGVIAAEEGSHANHSG